MSHEGLSNNQASSLPAAVVALGHDKYAVPAGEIRQFGDGMVDEFWTQPGLVFNMGREGRLMTSDPVSHDTGTVAVGVQTEKGRYFIFFDGQYALSTRQPNLAVDLSGFPVDAEDHDIVIGQPWHSPFGLTGTVESVAKPYTSGVRPGQSTNLPPEKRSASADGRKMLRKLGVGL